MDSKEVFEILMRENADMLSTYLRSVVWNAAAVDDLFQETLMVAWRRLDEFDRSRPFGPWLRGIASRLIMAHFRKAKRDMLVCNEAVLARLEQQVQKISSGKGDTWDDKVEELRACLEALPDNQRQAVDLHYMQEHTTREITEKEDVSREALKKRLQRARAALLECLRGKGILGDSMS